MAFQLSRPGGLVVAGLTMVCLMAAAAAPSPLYPIYQQSWRFSALTLTVIFAVYVVALLATMLTLGSLADYAGRRPVLVGSLLLLAVSMLLFVTASGVSDLIIARIVQGIATGACTGAATALIVDLQPDPRVGALVSGGSSPLGLAIGAALAGALVQYAPWPRELVYWVLLASDLLLVVALLCVPEPRAAAASDAPRALWQALRPRVGIPLVARPTFLRITPALLATWAPCGLYLSLGSSMIAHLLDVHDHMVVGLVLACFFAAAPLASMLASSTGPDARSAIGFGALAGGVVLTILAITSKSLALYVAGSILAGGGFGITFSLIMGAISSVTPPGDRSRTFAMVFIVAYAAFSVPAVLAGLAAQHWGLKSTFIAYGMLEVLVVAVAAIAARSSSRLQKAPQT
jgi:MFS family permease